MMIFIILLIIAVLILGLFVISLDCRIDSLTYTVNKLHRDSLGTSSKYGYGVLLKDQETLNQELLNSLACKMTAIETYLKIEYKPSTQSPPKYIKR